MPAIEALGLSRSYRTRSRQRSGRRQEHWAVRSLDFEVERGELFGVLGPNGAGKTTMLKMLNTLLLPTSGTARVLGYDVVDEPVAVRRRIGSVSGGDRGLYDRLSAWDNLRYFAELYDVDPRQQRHRIDEVLELVGLQGREKDRVEGYSRGMRQRLHIARGMLHQPAVLFLDEPSIGVDPVAARDLRRTISVLCATGTTIMLTTHYMLEADELCDRIAVIVAGRIRAQGTPADLKQQVGHQQMLEVEVFGGLDARHLHTLRSVPGVDTANVEERGPLQVLTIGASDTGPIRAAVLQALEGLRLGRVQHRQPTLEDAYVAIVQNGLLDEQSEAT